MAVAGVNADLRARLAEAEALLAEHKLRSQELEDARQVIQRELDKIVYPVLTIPSEITSEIFIQCLPPSPAFSAEEKEGPSPSVAPLLLLQICREWRSIAIATPQLWAHLHLNLVEDFPEPLEEVIEDWFSRAGCFPLSLSVLGYSGMDIEEPTKGDAISATLRRYAPQLESVALQIEQGQLMKLVGSGPFPRLGKLALSLPFHDDEEVDDGFWNLEIFADAPQLAHLHFGPNAILSLFPVPCVALSTISCHSLPINDFMRVLELAPFLRDFTCSVEYDDPFYDPDTITHGHLQTLRLTDCSSTQFRPLVRLPALQNLHLDIQSNGNNDFESFLASSSSSLRIFSTGRFIDALAVGWFSVMSGLTEVELYRPALAFLSPFSASLACTSDRNFLPHLKSLALVHCSLDMNPRIQFLTARSAAREGVVKLETFRQIWSRDSVAFAQSSSSFAPPSFAQSTRDTLRGLVEGGMKIHIGTSDVNYAY